ncbi:MAG: hypothetical protein PHI18_06230 [bacterium]|nr:hypothetical protein [bacterium]
MTRKLSFVLAAVAGIAVMMTGLDVYACGGSKSACGTKSSSAASTMKADGAGQCATSGSWTSNMCGSKGYYGANVFEIRDGKQYAVYEGKQFQVTDKTPYTQVENARYYFADKDCQINCTKTLGEKASMIDREAVSLATTEGNVVRMENGQKIARCPVTGREFAVGPKTEAKVMDGKKFYLASLETAQVGR